MSALRKREIGQALHQQAAPQPFPLTGDGQHMEHVWNRQTYMVLVERDQLAAAIVEARYRDWLAGREHERGRPKRKSKFGGSGR